jgi:hypothetical protein
VHWQAQCHHPLPDQHAISEDIADALSEHDILGVKLPGIEKSRVCWFCLHQHCVIHDVRFAIFKKGGYIPAYVVSNPGGLA